MYGWIRDGRVRDGRVRDVPPPPLHPGYLPTPMHAAAAPGTAHRRAGSRERDVGLGKVSK